MTVPLNALRRLVSSTAAPGALTWDAGSDFAYTIGTNWNKTTLPIRFLRGDRMRTMEGFVNEFGAVMQLAYPEKILASGSDQWLGHSSHVARLGGVLLIVLDSEELLADEPEYRESLLNGIFAAAEHYSRPATNRDGTERPRLPFHVILAHERQHDMIAWHQLGAQAIILKTPTGRGESETVPLKEAANWLTSTTSPGVVLWNTPHESAAESLKRWNTEVLPTAHACGRNMRTYDDMVEEIERALYESEDDWKYWRGLLGILSDSRYIKRTGGCVLIIHEADELLSKRPDTPVRELLETFQLAVSTYAEPIQADADRTSAIPFHIILQHDNADMSAWLDAGAGILKE